MTEAFEDSRHQKLSQIAAKIALLGLTQAASGREEGADVLRIMLPPDQRPLTMEQAAQLLAEFPKPVECKANFIDGTLIVDASPLRSPGAKEAHRVRVEQLDEGGGITGSLRQEAVGAGNVVTVDNGYEHLDVPLDALDLWIRDYLVYPLVLATRRRSSTEEPTWTSLDTLAGWGQGFQGPDVRQL